VRILITGLFNEMPRSLGLIAWRPAVYLVLSFWLPGWVSAQERIFRCGNEYTNSALAAQRGDCKPIAGGNLTVVQSPKLPAAGSVATRGRLDNPEQRTRDADTRQIIEAELRKAEVRRDELLKEYNNGEPEKIGKESKNYQKYLDRTAEMKSNINRVESDIAGLRRELDRLTSTGAVTSPPNAAGR
jgi:hypothetical protein